MRKIKVGIIQQANTADLRTNLMNLAKSIEACACLLYTSDAADE